MVTDRSKRKTGVPHPIDEHVGMRMRQRRTLMGFSQEKLGEAIGLTFQQIQKYERGANRIGASRLFELSSVLEVTVSYFFDEMPSTVAEPLAAAVDGMADEQEQFERDALTRRETLELVRAYYRIESPSVRKKVFELAKALAKITDEDDQLDPDDSTHH